VRTNVKQTIEHAQFIIKLNKAIAILKPLDRLIVKYQEDKVPISEVIPDFEALPPEFRKLRATNIINEEELMYLCETVDKRFQFIYSSAHGLAHMLDPRFIGVSERLPWARRGNLEKLLFRFQVDDVPRESVDEERAATLNIQYLDFVARATGAKREDSICYKLLVGKRLTVLDYCLLESSEWPELQSIAVKLFSMPTSSAASERNWSTMAFVHSKLRNALAPEKVEKLVFLKSNLPVFNDYDDRDANLHEEDDKNDDYAP